MGSYKQSDILKYIAREEPLAGTLKAFPGLTRERLAKMFEKLANHPTNSANAFEPEVNSTLNRVRVYSDGAARGNPGPSGAGAVLVEPSGQIVDRLGKFLGVRTNNYAEYMGLLLGGRYQVRSTSLRPLYDQALKLLNGFSRVKLVHVPREMNTAADEMSNR